MSEPGVFVDRAAEALDDARTHLLVVDPDAAYASIDEARRLLKLALESLEAGWGQP